MRDSFGKLPQFSTSFLADDFDICHGIEIPASTTEFSDLSMVFGGWMDSCLFESETSFNRALLPQQSHLATIASDLVQKYLDSEGFIDLDELINNSNIDEERPADAQKNMSGVECLSELHSKSSAVSPHCEFSLNSSARSRYSTNNARRKFITTAKTSNNSSIDQNRRARTLL